MEVAYLVIKNKEIELVAIVDDEMKIRIFGYYVIGIEELSNYSSISSYSQKSWMQKK